MDSSELGKFIAETRRQKGMTQEDLAQELHVTKQAVSRWERGVGYPDISLIEHLAEALGIGVDELISAHKKGKGETTDQKTLEAVHQVISIAVNKGSKRRERAFIMIEIILCILGTAMLLFSNYYSRSIYGILRSHIMWDLQDWKNGTYLPQEPPIYFSSLYIGLFLLIAAICIMVCRLIRLKCILNKQMDEMGYEDK